MTQLRPVARVHANQRSRRGIVIHRWILTVIGLLATAGALLQLGLGVVRGATAVDNPVFANVQRLPHAQTLAHHQASYGIDLLIIASWLLFLLLTAYVLAVLLHWLYRPAPVPVLAAGGFLGGALIAGLLIATSLMKVAEFTVQTGSAAPAEAEWLTAGINYLMQLHLFYVWGWILATGIGWIFLGAAARAAGEALRRGAALLLAAGTLFVVGTAARALLPLAGPTIPAIVHWVLEAVLSAGFGLGLLGCAALLARLGQPVTAQRSAPGAAAESGSPP